MMTSKNSYWKNEVFKNITKKIIIRKLIILLITAIIVFIPCYVMYNYIIHMPYSVVGSPNDFIQIQVALNSGISFSMFADSGFAVVFA
jgi:lipoprotein signal peptidase